MQRIRNLVGYLIGFPSPHQSSFSSLPQPHYSTFDKLTNMAWTDSPHPEVTTVDFSKFDYAKYVFPELLVKLEDGVLIVTLNRPKNYNAFNAEMCFSIVFAFELADLDPRVKVVVLTGAGDKAFCAGADLSVGKSGGKGDASGFGAGKGVPILHHRDGGGMSSGAILRCRKLVIVAMNGSAVGVGLTMVLPADIRIVSETAKIALPFTKRGICMEAMSSYFLPRLVGHSAASQIAMTGDTFLPSANCMRGLFTEILPQQEVFPYSLKLAKRLAQQNSVLSMAVNKTLLWRTPSSPEATHLIDSAGIAALSVASDAAEGVRSFLEKRPAAFEGKVEELENFGFYPWWTQVDVQGRGSTKIIRGAAKL